MTLIKFKDGMVEELPGDRQNVRFSDQSGTPVVVCEGPDGTLLWLANLTAIQYVEFYNLRYDETRKKIHARCQKALAKEKEEKQWKYTLGKDSTPTLLKEQPPKNCVLAWKKSMRRVGIRLCKY